jgi:ABC-type phosphate/phosphonate transport system substrate-binding protein
MNKKEFLLALCEKFEDTRLPAVWLKWLIEQDQLDEQLLDTLTQAFLDAAKNTQDSKLQQKLLKAADTIEQIKQLEQEDRLKELEELKELENMLNAI